MLHDIGVVRCNAPSIHCLGELPYICHGVAGREMLDNLGLHRHALVCERHTGSGLTVEDIIRQRLPLPHREMLPITTEEKFHLLCRQILLKVRRPYRGEDARQNHIPDECTWRGLSRPIHAAS